MQLLIFLWLALCLSTAQAQYSFPIKDPYYATITAGLLKADDHDPQLNYKDIKLQPHPKRSPHIRVKQNHITTRFWPSHSGESAPLVFMIAGLGGASSTSYINFLGNLFQKNGFHVLTLPSPMNWNFALAGSSSGIPGISKHDAQDLYNLMQMGLRDLKKENITITKIGLLGLSLGALNAAYVNELDKTQMKINFERVLLINPPLDSFYSLKILDDLMQEKTNTSESEMKNVFEKVKIYGANVLLLRNINHPDYVSDIASALPSTNSQRKYLIGSSMRDFLASLIFTTQQLHDIGLLKKTGVPARLAEANEYNFYDYIMKILIPGMQIHKSQYNFENLKVDSSLFSLEKNLREDVNTFLMHNEDDFIVNAEQIAWAKNIFGDRATIYPNGGHLGNLWFYDNRNKIIQTFFTLK